MQNLQTTDDLFKVIKQEAANTVITKMEGYGSSLSTLHKRTLQHVAGQLVQAVCLDLPISIKQRRVAVPLSVGVGKTLLFTAVLEALNVHKIDYSALVCTSSLEEMARCYDQLTENGNEDCAVGCLHSADAKTMKEHGLPNSVVSPKSYRVLFVSHARVENEDFMRRELNTYFGNKRDICIWDESMSKTAAIHLKLDRVVEAVEPLKVIAQRRKGPKGDNLRAILNTLSNVYTTLQAAANDGEAKTFNPYPVVATQDRAALKAALKSIDNRASQKVISTYVRLVENGFRLMVNDESEIALGFAMVIPKELNSCFIFDASSTISQLTALDSRITMMEGVDYENVKRFSACKLIQHSQFSTSKEALNSKSQLKSKLLPVLDGVMEVIASIPDNEAVLICSAKPRKGHTHEDHAGFYNCLDDALRASDRDYDTRTVTVDGQELPRINYITWGQHRATSAFKHCQHIIAVGVMRRRTDELRAAAMGQMESLDDPRLETQGFTAYVQRCEAFTAVQQLMGRGTARIISDGEAQPSTLHLFDREAYAAVRNPASGVSDDLVQRALPGIVYEQRRGFMGEAIAELVQLLNDTPGKTVKMSIASWTKQSAKYQQLTDTRQTANARDEAVSIVRDLWKREGRSLVRRPC